MKFKLTLLSLFMAAALPALAQTPVYLDTNKSVEERVKDALTRMTLEEKVAMIHAQSKFSSPTKPRDGYHEDHLLSILQEYLDGVLRHY